MKEFYKGLKEGIKEFGHNINMIINSLLLTIVYLIGVGATSIAAKIVGKRFLDRKISKEKDSYWEDLNLKKKKKEEYYRQF